jgi:sarcosine oxidase subunit gamma
MPDTAIRTPVLAATMTAPGVEAEMAAPLARFIFRGDEAARKAAGKAFGATLSEVPCRASISGARAVLWLGPDEFLLLAPDGEGAAIEAAIADALGETPHSLVDVSHRQTAINLTGAKASTLLALGCPLDLDASVFAVGACTRTVFAKAEITLWRRDDTRFHVEVWRSFAPYVWGLLGEALMELSV